MLTPSLAGAMVAHETAAPRAGSRRDPSGQRPWPASVAASAWPSLCHASAQPGAAGGVSSRAASKNYSTRDTSQVADVRRPRPCRAWRPVDPPPAPHGLDHLGIQELRQRHPAQLRRGTLGMAALGLDPLPIVGQQSRHVLAKAIGQKQWDTVGRQHLSDVVDNTLRHGEGAISDLDREEQLACGVQRHPETLGRPFQALDGLGRADLPVLHRAEEGEEFIHLHLLDPHVVQDVAGKGLELVCCFNEPLQYSVGIHLEHPRRAPDTQPFSQARNDAHDELDRSALAVKDRAEGLEKIAVTGDAEQLPPGTAVRMAIGAEITPAHPAAIGTVRVRAEMLRGIYLAFAATCGGDPWRRNSRRGARGGLQSLLTRGTRGLVGEASKRFCSARALARR